ncbi:MAG: HAD-IA family hydrolase [Hyphomicrobiales bacterium]|nr:HAD-IA family hydrolase [Hyphomicrobiales bacterium]
MSLDEIKALTFDTGGTILDWHSGFATALQEAGNHHGIDKDWPALANEIRRCSLKLMVNLGEHEAPTRNFDDGHRMALDKVLALNDFEILSSRERRKIWWDAVHNLQCWPDFPAVLPKLRQKYYCASFTILSFRIIIDTAKKNNLDWDAVFSCEAIGKYKFLPESYSAVTKFLQFQPEECCMIACHNWDLDAAKAVGFKTAFVRRPREWGDENPPDPEPNPNHDIIVDTFPELAQRLGVRL